jgi:hypothetical protein
MTLDPALLEPRIRAIGEDLARRSSGIVARPVRFPVVVAGGDQLWP